MKITILYDNVAARGQVEADWGFSCLVELVDQRILFDTGGCGHILLSNMEKLGVDPRSIDWIFISHNHFDHIGGLSQMLHEKPGITVCLPSSMKGVKRAGKLITVGEEPMEISHNVYSTGEIEGEQALVIKTPKGLVLMTGCSHPGVAKFLEVARQWGEVTLLIGGFHGLQDFSLLKGIPRLCPTHCTKRMLELKTLFPDIFVPSGAGREIVVE